MENISEALYIDISGTEDYDYDQWLDFFNKKLTASQMRQSIDWIQDNVNPTGYAAARRWLEIFDNPSKMEKLYKARLDKQEEENIMDIAIGDNDEAFYETLIRQNVVQLQSSSTSPQEVARITQNINIFRKSLHEIRSRRPKEGSTLAKVLEAANTPKKLKKSTSVKKKVTVSKAAGASKKKKMNSKSLKGAK